jgi:hypothetical protein
MASPYYITVKTASVTVNNEGDTVELWIKFTNSGTGTTADIVAETSGIRVADWGVIEWTYDFEDAFLVPGVFTVKLWDSDLVLRDMFFGTSATNLAFAKNPKATLWLNGVEEYIGTVQEDSVLYDMGEQSVTFTCDAQTSILNKTLLYDDDNAPLNPLGVTESIRYPILSMILLAYQLVDDTIAYPANLEISYDWLFSGVRFDPADSHPLTNMTFVELEGLSTYFFFDSTYGLTTVGDFLKKLALDFCAYTGLIHEKRAFFKKLFYYDATNVQTLGTVLNRQFNYRYGLLDYVEVTTQTSGNHTYSTGTDNNIVDRTLKLLSIPECRSDFNSNLWALVNRTPDTDDGEYNVYTVKDPILLSGAFSDLGDLQVAFWGNFRMNQMNCRVDHLTVSGIDYDFLKNFVDDGRKYQIVGMKKKIASNITEIDAIYLGLDS